ncbi:MAG: hypothetical protein AAB267_05725, partial [Candidatus Desantisbacteria bacterium]
MFKEKVMKGAICLGVMGMLLSSGLALGKKPAKDGQDEAAEQKGTQTVEAQQREKGTQATKEIYVPKEILSLSWGTGNYQVGVQKGPEIEFVGPQEVRIDKKGNILILDTINGRILKYSNKGKFISSIKINTWAQSMCFKK